MVAELIVAPEAEQDLVEAYAWYESQRIGFTPPAIPINGASVSSELGRSAAQQWIRADSV